MEGNFMKQELYDRGVYTYAIKLFAKIVNDF